jgi:hypothetical protein
MTRDQWKLSHQAIGISETGMLLDGQHRLRAIIKSGKTIPIYVVTGLKDDVMTVIDTGSKRSTGDAFGLLEVSQANNIAAAIQQYYKIKTGAESFAGVIGGKTGSSTTMSNQEKYDFYLNNEALIEKVLRVGLKCYSAVRFYSISRLIGMSLYLVLDKDHTFSLVEEFWLNVHMISEKKIPACKVLSSVLLKYLSGSEVMKSRYKSAITVKAWNAYIKGSDVKILKFSTDEGFPEFI